MGKGLVRRADPSLRSRMTGAFGAGFFTAGAGFLAAGLVLFAAADGLAGALGAGFACLAPF